MIKEKTREVLQKRCTDLSGVILDLVKEKTEDLLDPEQNYAVKIGALHTAYHSLGLIIYGKEQFLSILKETIKITEDIVFEVEEKELKAEVKKTQE